MGDGLRRWRWGVRRLLRAAGAQVEAAIGQHPQFNREVFEFDPRGIDASGKQRQGIENQIRLGGCHQTPPVGLADHEVIQGQRQTVVLPLDRHFADVHPIGGAEFLLQGRGQQRLEGIEIDPPETENHHQRAKTENQREQRQRQAGSGRMSRPPAANWPAWRTRRGEFRFFIARFDQYAALSSLTLLAQPGESRFYGKFSWSFRSAKPETQR